MYRHNFSCTLTTKCINDDISFFQSLTNKPWSAVADETIQSVHARCAILTRLRRTIIKCVLASLPCITWFARTSEIVYAVFALSVILTRCTGTVIYIHITHCTCKRTISQENEVILTLQLVYISITPKEGGLNLNYRIFRPITCALSIQKGSEIIKK